jgi:hypothetical protein
MSASKKEEGSGFWRGSKDEEQGHDTGGELRGIKEGDVR